MLQKYEILGKINKYQKYNSCSHAIMWHQVLQRGSTMTKRNLDFYKSYVVGSLTASDYLPSGAWPLILYVPM